MKKKDKLNLTADIFKANHPTPAKTPPRTPSRTSPRTPTTPTPTTPHSTNDPLHLFQKVCCPNCRYVFKVLRLEQPEGGLKGGLKGGSGKEQETQCQDSMVREMQELKRLNEELSRRLNGNLKDSSIFKRGSLGNDSKSQPQLAEQMHIKSKMFKLQLLSPRSTTPRHSDHPDTPLQRSHLRIKPEAVQNTQEEAQTQQPIQQEATEQKVNRQEVSGASGREYGPGEKEQLKMLVGGGLLNRQLVECLSAFCRQVGASVDIPSHLKALVGEGGVEVPD